MKNRAVKISVTIPLNLLEKLDKITTYKGKSRSRYIAGAVTQRLQSRKVDNMDDMPFTALVSMMLSHDDTPHYVRAILEEYVRVLNDT